MGMKMNRATKYFLLLAGWLSCATVSEIATAQQVIDVAEGDAAIVQISSKDLTRIRIANGHISNIRGNDGELVVDADKDKGEVYIRPTAPERPVNVYVTSASGSTYTLLLTPKDIPGSTVVLRERGATTELRSTLNGTNDYLKSVEKLVLSMARNDIPRAVEIKEKGKKIPLWRGTSYVIEREYWTDGLVGEIYTLTNTGNDPIVMTEGEFYRDGILAVSVETMSLNKDESTNVYIVRKRMPNE